jgi:hypothetical protein
MGFQDKPELTVFRFLSEIMKMAATWLWKGWMTW